MSVLSFTTSDENGLSFDLLIDDVPLRNLVGGANGIPYWIFEGDLPYLPLFGDSSAIEREERIVCVCSCGEYGCGHTSCRVIKDSDTVIFRDFDNMVSSEGQKKQFRFSRQNYDAVVAEIVTASAEKKSHA